MADTIADLTKKVLERDTSQYESFSVYGSATAPGAGAAISSIASAQLPAGYYQIDVEASIDAGAPAAADRDNMEVREGATTIKRIVVNPVSNTVPARVSVRRVLDGATNVSVNAVGAGTASVVYRASITATRLAT